MVRHSRCQRTVSPLSLPFCPIPFPGPLKAAADKYSQTAEAVPPGGDGSRACPLPIWTPWTELARINAAASSCRPYAASLPLQHLETESLRASLALSQLPSQPLARSFNRGRPGTVMLVTCGDAIVQDDRFLHWWTLVVRSVAALVRHHQGDLFFCCGGWILAGWNTHFPNPHQEVAAVACALALCQELRGLVETQGALANGPAGFTISLDKNVIWVPPTNSVPLAALTVGPALLLLVRLATLAPILQAPILVTQPIYEAVRGKFDALMVDYVSAQGSAAVSAQIRVYELVGPTAQESPHRPLKEVVTNYKLAVVAFGQRKYSTATALFLSCLRDLQTVEPKGPVELRHQHHAARLLEVCWHLLHRTDSTVAGSLPDLPGDPEVPNEQTYMCRQDGWEQLERDAARAAVPRPGSWEPFLAAVKAEQLPPTASCRTATVSNRSLSVYSPLRSPFSSPQPSHGFGGVSAPHSLSVAALGGGRVNCSSPTAS